MLRIIGDVKDGAPQDSDLRELLTVLEARVDSSFEAMVRDVGATMQTHLHDRALAPQDASNQFWMNVQQRYGKGRGYRDDVLAMYADQIEGHERVLAEAAEEAWQRVVIDPILVYLAEG